MCDQMMSYLRCWEIHKRFQIVFIMSLFVRQKSCFFHIISNFIAFNSINHIVDDERISHDVIPILCVIRQYQVLYINLLMSMFIRHTLNILAKIVDFHEKCILSYLYMLTKWKFRYLQIKLEIVDQWSTRIPPPHRKGWQRAMGGLQLNIVQNHKADILKAT